MVAHPCARLRTVDQGLDAGLPQQGSVADAGALQNRGRHQRAGRENDLTRRREMLRYAGDPRADARRAPVLERDLIDGDTGHDLDVRSLHRGTQKHDCGALPAARADVVRVVADAFLVLAVEVVVTWQTHLLARGDQRFGHRIAKPIDADVDRPAAAAHAVVAELVILDGTKRGFHGVPAPAAGAARFPVRVIRGLATHVDHPVE